MFVVEQGGAIRIIENGAAGQRHRSWPSPRRHSWAVASVGSCRWRSIRTTRSTATSTSTTPRAGDGALTIARYTRSTGNPRLADPGSAQVLLTIPHPTSLQSQRRQARVRPGWLPLQHPWRRRQWRRSVEQRPDAGHAARQAAAHRCRRRIRRTRFPTDNPFVGIGGVRPEIFAYGLRNVWRMSFDRLTGDLYLGDVGQGQREEIDLIPATSPGGENFGWRVWEGTRCNTSVATTSQCAALAQVPPILEYDHSASGAGTGPCGGSVTGGVRYRVHGDPCALRSLCLRGLLHRPDLDGRAYLGRAVGEIDLRGHGHVRQRLRRGCRRRALFLSRATARSIASRRTRRKRHAARRPQWRRPVRPRVAQRNDGCHRRVAHERTSPTRRATVLFTDPNWRVTHTAATSTTTEGAISSGATPCTNQAALWLMDGTSVLGSALLPGRLRYGR